LNVPAIVGFGMACELASQEMAVEGARLQFLRDSFEKRLT
jgi:cysteine desulfurase